jgi:tellurite resistance protein TehA-like permease
MVMATGIVSAGMRQVGQPHIAGALLVVALASFALLVAATAARAAAFPAVVRAELTCPDRAFTGFALVAAANVLAVRLLQDGHRAAALALAAAGLAAWLGLSYLVPPALAARAAARPAITDVNGTWYLWVVGTQSLAVAAAFPRAGWFSAPGAAALVAVSAWCSGVMLYLLVTVLVLARLLLAGVPDGDPAGPYWISMGGASISVFAAARILQMAGSPLVAAARPVITGAAVMLWAFATWLIPLLIVLTARLRLRAGARRGYHAGLWAAAFPLGMYGMAGLELGAVIGVRPIREIGAAAVFPAAIVWALTFVAMIAAPLRPRAEGPRSGKSRFPSETPGRRRDGAT